MAAQTTTAPQPGSKNEKSSDDPLDRAAAELVAKAVAKAGECAAAGCVLYWRWRTGLPLLDLGYSRRLSPQVHAVGRLTGEVLAVGMVLDWRLTLALTGLTAAAGYTAVRVRQDHLVADAAEEQERVQAAADAARPPVRVDAQWGPLPVLTAGPAGDDDQDEHDERAAAAPSPFESAGARS